VIVQRIDIQVEGADDAVKAFGDITKASNAAAQELEKFQAPDWSQLADGADEAIKTIQDAFKNIDISDQLPTPSWDKLTEGIDTAEQKLKDAFKDIGH
jgi:hypothetical protein